MHFDRDFEVVLANTEESKLVHYALRYKVYCQQRQFEDPVQFDNQLEIDKYDNTSVHFIARSKKTKEWIGAIRIIIADLHHLPTYNLLPEHSLHRYRILKELQDSVPGIASEASRLCSLSPRRKAPDCCSSVVSEKDTENETIVHSVEKRQQSEIMLGLLRAVYVYCLNKKIDICLFTVSKSLARILKSFGLNFIQVGRETNYHGMRVPYCMHTSDFLGRLHFKSPEVYKMFVHTPAYRLFDPAIPEWVPSTLAK